MFPPPVFLRFSLKKIRLNMRRISRFSVCQKRRSPPAMWRDNRGLSIPREKTTPFLQISIAVNTASSWFQPPKNQNSTLTSRQSSANVFAFRPPSIRHLVLEWVVLTVLSALFFSVVWVSQLSSNLNGILLLPGGY